MPSRFVPTVAFLFNVLSLATLVPSKAKTRFGISTIPTGDCLETSPCDLEKLSRLGHASE